MEQFVGLDVPLEKTSICVVAREGKVICLFFCMASRGTAFSTLIRQRYPTPSCGGPSP